MGFHVEHSIHIDAPPEQVYEYVTDVARHPDWANEQMQMEHQSGPVRGVGAVYKSTIKFMGTIPGRVEVMTDERAKRFVYQCTDKGGCYDWIFEVESEGNGTKLRQINERVSSPAYVKLIQGMIYRAYGKKMITNSLANIKRNIEQGVAAA